MITLLIKESIRMMAVYVFGASGDVLMEKGGHLNMGVPGIMFFGALGGIIGEITYANSVPIGTALNGFMILFAPIMMGMLFGAIGGLLYCLLTVTLKCNQNVVGLSLTTFGVGASKYFISTLTDIEGSRVQEAAFKLQNLFSNYKAAGTFGEMFLSGSFFTYFAIIVAILISIILARTKIGLNLRAVGENPASADASGINVNKYKYLSTIIGAMIVALGGVTYSLDVVKGAYSPTNVVDSFGWLCLSIVILSAWRSWITILVSFAIGFFSTLPIIYGSSFATWVVKLMDAIPYVASIVVLIISSAIGSKKMQPPAGLGKTYFREDR